MMHGCGIVMLRLIEIYFVSTPNLPLAQGIEEEITGYGLQITDYSCGIEQ
jgi:hypothetical protein